MTGSEHTTARKALGLTREQLADHIGRSKSIIDKWEAGAQPVDLLAARYLTALVESGWRPTDWQS